MSITVCDLSLKLNAVRACEMKDECLFVIISPSKKSKKELYLAAQSKEMTVIRCVCHLVYCLRWLPLTIFHAEQCEDTRFTCVEVSHACLENDVKWVKGGHGRDFSVSAQLLCPVCKKRKLHIYWPVLIVWSNKEFNRCEWYNDRCRSFPNKPPLFLSWIHFNRLYSNIISLENDVQGC